MHGDSFEQIGTKFVIWHPYTLQMVMGGVLASAARAQIGATFGYPSCV